MNRLVCISFLSVLFAALFCSATLAWDVSYDGTTLPNDAALGAAVWTSAGENNLANSSVADGILHLVDQDAQKAAYFYREPDIPAGTPLTLEARVRIVSGAGDTSDVSPARINVGRIDGCVRLELWPDKVKCDSSTHDIDLTAFHVIRVALQSDNHYQVWLDSTEVISGTTSSGAQSGILFGSSWSVTKTMDSYWDYVSYSMEYLPIK